MGTPTKLEISSMEWVVLAEEIFYNSCIPVISSMQICFVIKLTDG